MPHFKGDKDAIAYEIAEWLARNSGDNQAGQSVTGVAVVPFRARNRFCSPLFFEDRTRPYLVLDFPYYVIRRMSRVLKRRGYEAGRRKARYLMRILGVEAIYYRGFRICSLSM